MKSDSSPERDHAHDYDITKEVTGGNKKRKRKPYRPGEEGHDAASHMITGHTSCLFPLHLSSCSHLPLRLHLYLPLHLSSTLPVCLSTSLPVHVFLSSPPPVFLSTSTFLPLQLSS